MPSAFSTSFSDFSYSSLNLGSRDHCLRRAHTLDDCCPAVRIQTGDEVVEWDGRAGHDHDHGERLAAIRQLDRHVILGPAERELPVRLTA